jgi:hypothetical protein
MQTTHRVMRRRNFLQIGSAGVLLTLPRVLRAEAAGSEAPSNAKNVILIWLGGGPATIDMWDPKPDAPEYIRGEFATIGTTVPDVRICEHLPKTAQLLNRCTLVRSIRHSIPAHEPGSRYMLTGHLPSAATEYPALGSIAASRLDHRAAVPAYVAFNNPTVAGPGYLGSARSPFQLEENIRSLPSGVSLGENVDVSAFTARVGLRRAFDRRFDALNRDLVVSGLDTFHQQAVDVLQKDSIRRALDTEQEPQKVQEAYGQRSPLGRNALRACRLIEAGARFVTIGTTGWDTHSNNFALLRTSLLPQLDLAFSALVTELEERGLLASTIVYCCGEFGRTPQVNGTAGRDHWSRAMSALLAGGGLHAGLVYGQTDAEGGEPVLDECSPADLSATLLHRLGIDPQSTLTTPGGREMPILRDGRVLRSLLV